MTTETQSPLDAARKLGPMIRSSADQSEADRELPRPLFEALADAGLFLIALPRALGGAEIDLPTYVQVLEEIGKADASARPGLPDRGLRARGRCEGDRAARWSAGS